MYYCDWCKSRTQNVVLFPHNGWGCALEAPSHEDHCEACDWERELLCSVCEGGVIEVEFSVFNKAEDTETSLRIFEGWVKTPELSHILCVRMTDKLQYEEDYKLGLWTRGNICRALAAKGISQSMINFMKS